MPVWKYTHFKTEIKTYFIFNILFYAYSLDRNNFIWRKHTLKVGVERTSNFFLAHKSTLPLVSSDIFTQWGWHFILPGPFPGNSKTVKERHFISSSVAFEQDGRLSVRSSYSSDSPPRGYSRLVHGPWGLHL